MTRPDQPAGEAQADPALPVGLGPPVLLDTGLGVVIALAGAALFLHSFHYAPMIPNTVIGPGLLLRICAVVFMVSGVAMLPLSALRAGHWRHRGLSRHGFAVVPVALLALILLLTPAIGLLAAAMLAAVLFMRANGAGWGRAVLVSALLGGVVYLAFSEVMRVPLPPGSLF